jgi:hypothetical protein
MALMSKYRGLCETCDHDAVCTMKRSPRLEIIHCEQFSTQPVMHKQAVSPRNSGIATCGARRLSDESVDLSCGSGLQPESAKTEC